MPPNHDERLARANCSLEGLSVGDAFGEQFFPSPYRVPAFANDYAIDEAIEKRLLPASPWRYTDDAQMALSIYSILRQYGDINQGMLAFNFGAYYDPSRGYGPAMHWLLPRLSGINAQWDELAHSLFNGQGSFGNGGAMRVAPIGAYFADDLDAVVEQARLATEVTHAHPEATAGAIAVAVAAALAWQLSGKAIPNRQEFLDKVLPNVPDGDVRAGIQQARDLPVGVSVIVAMSKLGNGSQVSAQDTVPFVLWCAGEQLDNYEEALWLTVSGLGDRDTTCAMVGGIVALSAGVDTVPNAWLQAREPLPHWPFQEQNEL